MHNSVNKSSEILEQIRLNNNNKMHFYESQGAILGGSNKIDKELSDLVWETFLLYSKLDDSEIYTEIGRNISNYKEN